MRGGREQRDSLSEKRGKETDRQTDKKGTKGDNMIENGKKGLLFDDHFMHSLQHDKAKLKLPDL